MMSLNIFSPIQECICVSEGFMLHTHMIKSFHFSGAFVCTGKEMPYVVLLSESFLRKGLCQLSDCSLHKYAGE